MKKILFAYDFSEASLNAFVYALYLAHKTKSELTTLHVFDRAAIRHKGYYDQLLDNYDLSEWDLPERYIANVPKLHAVMRRIQIEDVPAEHLLEQGSAAEIIADVCLREKADLIVMGTTGATGFAEAMLGSVTERVMDLACCAVLAIPEKAYFQYPTKVLFLTDLEAMEFSSLQRLIAFSKPYRAHIDVLHIKQKHDPKEKLILEKWQSKFTGRETSFYIQTGLTADEVAFNFLAIKDSNLVAVTGKHRSFLSRVFLYSYSRQLAFHMQIPILSLAED